MIVGMRKLHLAVLSYDRDRVLDALGRTQAAEIGEVEADAPALKSDREELSAALAALEETLAAISSFAPETKEGAAALKDGFAVSYSEFVAAKDYRPRAEELIERVKALTEKRAEADRETARLAQEISAAKPYAASAVRFSDRHDTAHTAVRYGLVGAAAWDLLKGELDGLPLTAYEATMSANGVLLLAVCHRDDLTGLETALAGASFSACPYTGEMTGEELLSSLTEKQNAARAKKEEAERALTDLLPEVRPLKVYCDYVGFELEKAEASEKMQATQHVVFMKAFVPTDGEARVREELEGLGIPLFYEFSDPDEDEEIPTRLKNNAVIENFEVVTNMYSVPNARELDPNPVMAFFYSLFLGFIMADMGYGIAMAVGGYLLWKKAKGGVRSIAGVFAVSGISTFLWGILFNSLFGIRVLPFTVMPDAQTEMYSLAGIALPSILIIALLLGILQIMVGYVCKFAQCVHHGRPWDGVFEGLTWAAFSLGAELAVIGLVEEFSLPVLTMVGGILAGVSLLAAVLTAGRKQKFLGKITKGFGALYGLINYFTDVLSYIRLYGLMLTGAVIAQVVSDYSLQFLTSGSFLVVLGAILMVVGHVFNLAISLLGAYIHTARLQYVEFFGRFYEGEGRLFEPLGSRARYITLEPAPRAGTSPQREAA